MIDKWTMVYLAAAAGAFAVTAVLTPLFRAIALRTGFMDRPAANHKGHARATALLGGLAMFTGWILCIASGIVVVRMQWLPAYFAETLPFHLEGFREVAAGKLSFIVAGAFLAVLLGLIDDKWALSAKWKFAGQFAVACIAVFLGGVEVNIFVSSRIVTAAASIFWIMLMMNSINFFDNMDGLAAGTIAIAMGFFTVIAAFNGEYFSAIFSAVNFGICCGFWIYNANPASIFMGDSGSHFLGYIAAVAAAGETFFDKGYSLSRFPVLIPLMILALPLFDTAMVVIIRTLNGKPFWIGDHNHISHRFVRMGLSRKSAVMLVHLTALNIALGTLPVFWGDFRTAAIIVLQAMLLIAVITILQISLESRKDACENHSENHQP